MDMNDALRSNRADGWPYDPGPQRLGWWFFGAVAGGLLRFELVVTRGLCAIGTAFMEGAAAYCCGYHGYPAETVASQGHAEADADELLPE